MKKIQAKYYHRGRLRKVRLLVVHSMEAPEKPDTAEAVARWFATNAPKTSAHVCFDNDSAVRCVDDDDTAWCAPNANADGLHGEFAGYARQKRGEWLDDYGTAMLAIAARQYAVWADKYSIPVVKLTPAEVRAGKHGFCGHRDVTAAYPGTGTHTDPGTDFPWDYFLGLVKDELARLRNPVPAKPVTWSRTLVYSKAKPMMKGSDVTAWQKQLVKLGHNVDVDGVYGPDSTAKTKAFQREAGLLVTGAVDKTTWETAAEKTAAGK
ncbi:peptidoglycan recognition protein family protein (plasmid) [Microtetraspora malaysiensis]|uniref:peptidoglycan recognition protein family protein n=1 Tax=Microtetraspora malaysiensis TaxID=161358 RepID=UPI003D92A075